MPNITYETLEAIPEGLKEYAKQTDGKFVVDVVPGVKLAEFRDNNVALSQQRDVLATTMAKLKPVIGESIEDFLARHAELENTAKKVKDGALKGTDAIEAEVTNRVGAMKTGYETQLAEEARKRQVAEQAKEEADARYNNSIIDRSVTDAVVSDKSGANPGALEDILTRAKRVFQVVDGKLVAKDGAATIYGADGATPMTPMEWLTKLRSSAPYLFKASNGGGANGGQNGGNAAYGGLSKQDYDKLSPQAKLDLVHRAKFAKGK